MFRFFVAHLFSLLRVALQRKNCPCTPIDLDPVPPGEDCLWPRGDSGQVHQEQQQGPGQELTCCWGVFCSQVFFDNDPSSSTRGETQWEMRETAGSGGYGGSRGPQHNQTTPVISKRVREWDVTREVLRPRSGAHTTQLMMIENSDQWLQDWGPAQELTQPCKLLSSAARSSLITILLLQPVFFLRSASRPGPNVWGESTGARPATQEKILWQWW